MKKRYFLIGIPILLMVVVCFFFVVSLFTVHENIIEESHYYQPQSIISFDKRYILKTHRIQEATGVYATFSVERQDTQKEIFNCSDRYRTMDLKSISWDDATLDIIVESGDIGSISYQFVNDTWETQ